MSRTFAIPSKGSAFARQLIRTTLAGRGSESIHSAELMTTELVTNAQMHAPGPVNLVIDLDEARLRVEVVDAGAPTPLRPLDVDVSSEHGRGLLIVNAMATSWGVEPRGSGKAVWFELALES